MVSLNRYIRLALNIFCALLLIVAFILFEKIIKPFERGFFCDDESIQKPYVTQQTVSVTLLVVLIFASIIITITSCEYFRYVNTKNACKKPIKFRNIKINPNIYRLVSNILLSCIGLCICLIITGIGKRMCGRLRPHFLAVCKPDYTKFNCSDGFITFDVCTQLDDKKLKEARLSFPSGHASSALFTGTLVGLYIEYTIITKHFNLAKVVLQLLAICLALACAFTRISDYFHHWSDVLAGGVIGVACAMYTIIYLIKLPPASGDQLYINKGKEDGQIQSNSCSTVDVNV